MKKLFILTVAMMMLLTMPGCMKNVDKRYKGLSIGFNYTGPRYYTIMSAVRSDKKEFAIDDVTVDLYTGYFSESISSETTAIIAFYVVAMGAARFVHPQDNYHTVDNQYFITEISGKEFHSNFAASQTRKKGKVFSHEGIQITIPQAVFEKEQGYIYLYAQYINLSDEDGLYHFTFAYSGRVTIRYEYIDDNTVKLG